jgi:hypothetical protein
MVRLGRARSYSIITDPDAPTREMDSFTCRHCCKVTFVKPFCPAEDMGGRCYVCDGLICTKCVGKGCDPMEKKLLRWEARDRLYQATRA